MANAGEPAAPRSKLDQVALLVGIILGLANLFGLYGYFFWGGKKRKGGGQRQLVSNKEYDMLGFWNRLKKGVIEVGLATKRDDVDVDERLRIFINADNEVVLDRAAKQDSPSTAPLPSLGFPAYKLGHLAGVRLFESAESGEALQVCIDFSEGEAGTLAIKCWTEEDALFIAQGFHQLSSEYLSDPKFVESLLSGRGVFNTQVGGNGPSSPTILGVATAIMSIPVLPIYGLVRAFESKPVQPGPSSPQLGDPAPADKE